MQKLSSKGIRLLNLHLLFQTHRGGPACLPPLHHERTIGWRIEKNQWETDWLCTATRIGRPRAAPLTSASTMTRSGQRAWPFAATPSHAFQTKDIFNGLKLKRFCRKGWVKQSFCQIHFLLLRNLILTTHFHQTFDELISKMPKISYLRQTFSLPLTIWSLLNKSHRNGTRMHSLLLLWHTTAR